ncbi:MAG: hypothetical protein ACKOUT_04105 [Novosphingobium sp.]
MFDPAASLMKTIGLALPIEAAAVAAAQGPGEAVEAAGNGDFAGLLAMKLQGVDPAPATPPAPQVLPGTAVLPVAPTSQPSAPIDPAAKPLPATGNILPLALPPAQPLAQRLTQPQIILQTLSPAVPQPAPMASPSVQLPAQPRGQAPVQPSGEAPNQPAPSAVTLSPEAPTFPASVTTPAIPDKASDAAGLAPPQPAPPATAPSRRRDPRTAPNITPVSAAAGNAAAPVQQVRAPQVTREAAQQTLPAPSLRQAALPAMPAKQRTVAPRSAVPEPSETAEPHAARNTAPDQGESDVLIGEAVAVVPAILVPIDLAPPAPVAAAAGVQPANPAPAEFTRAPAAAVTAAPARAPALSAQTAAPVPQSDAAPAQAVSAPVLSAPVMPSPAITTEVTPSQITGAPVLSAQVRVAVRFPAQPAGQDGEAPRAAATARRAEDSPIETALPASPRYAAPPPALPAAALAPAPASISGHVAVQVPSASQGPADFAQIVDRLVAARDAVAPAEVRLTLDHAQFGKVSVGFTPDAAGMNVTLAAADPEFARAVEAAAPFAPPTISETPQVTAPSPARGSDLPSAFTGQQGQQPGRQPQADPRPGTPQSNHSPRNANSAAEDSRRRGIFA